MFAYSKEGNSSILAHVATTTSVFAVLVGAAALFTTASAVYRLNAGPSVTINPAPWKWLGEVNFKSAPVEELPAYQEALLHWEQPVIKAIAVEGPRISLVGRKTVKRHASVRRIIQMRQPVVAAKSIHIDLIHHEVAAPVRIDNQEFTKLQAVHSLLHAQFMTAVLTPHMEKVHAVAAIQVAPARVTTQGQTPVETKTAHKPKAKVAQSKVATQRGVAAREYSELNFKHSHLSAVPAASTPIPLGKIVRDTHNKVGVDLNRPTAQTLEAVNSQTLSKTALPSLNNDKDDELNEASASTRQNKSTPQTMAAQSAVDSHDTHEAGMKVLSQAAGNFFTSVGQINGYSARPGYSTPSGYPAIAAPAVNAAPVKPMVVSPSVPTPSALATLNQEARQASAPSLPACPATVHVEAFDWNRKLDDVEKVLLTHELKTACGDSGWAVSKSSDHWPTLSWANLGPVALISQNTAHFLAALSGTALQSEAGIIFGKVPSGWSVELSGRSEHILYFNPQNQVISSGNSDTDRTFALLNVLPGTQFISVTHGSDRHRGVVAVPVTGGMSTYVDLSLISTKKITGTVLDGGSPDFEGMHGIHVTVLGQPAEEAFTDANGNFAIEDITTIATYPVYVETEGLQNYKHRYRLNPVRLENTLLFRLPYEQIDDWVNQLEGGMSAESGMVVAAIPGLVKANLVKDANGKSVTTLQAETHPLNENATLIPETYNLQPNGQLEVATTISPESPRYFSLQIPEGPAITEVKDKNQKVIWSELVISQPQVVNIIGPY